MIYDEDFASRLLKVFDSDVQRSDLIDFDIWINKKGPKDTRNHLRYLWSTLLMKKFNAGRRKRYCSGRKGNNNTG
jgi:phosphatidylserine/phosphatidylglycerophosphate/cardiolipin synthase-like enzyme